MTTRALGLLIWRESENKNQIHIYINRKWRTRGLKEREEDGVTDRE